MAGLYATLSVTGNQLALDATEKPFTFYFRGAKQLYLDPAWATATGITDVSGTHQGEVVLTDVGDLLLHGILRTAEVEIVDAATKLVLAIKRVRYSGLKSATIEQPTPAGIVNLTWKGISTKLNGRTIKAVIESRRMITD
ncbi:hypothetical protein [Nostoc sp.]|uniref:hypothetical protein n=1 Tax=Nostoc sp. TaxID=1180 RepID=UPI002FFBE1D0